jgi:hypothetical protein
MSKSSRKRQAVSLFFFFFFFFFLFFLGKVLCYKSAKREWCFTVPSFSTDDQNEEESKTDAAEASPLPALEMLEKTASFTGTLDTPTTSAKGFISSPSAATPIRVNNGSLNL